MNVSSHQLASSFEVLLESKVPNNDIDLVLVHGNPSSLEEPALLEYLCEAYPRACIAGCSGAGEIMNGEVYENSIVYSAIHFEHTSVRQTSIKIEENKDDEYEAGKALAQNLIGDDLVAVIILSEGLSVDCDEFIKGVREIMGPEAPFFGGLAGDGNSFEHTVVLDRDGVYDDHVVAIGLYGKRLEVNSSTSIFDQKGIELDITASDGNIIYEINDQPALDIYKSLIANQSMPEISLRLYYPLIILDPKTRNTLYCRTIHEYDVGSKSLLAAGVVCEGPAKLINMTNSEDLFQDAITTSQKLKNIPAEFAIIYSCAGRRGAMGDEWDKEAPLIQQSLEGIPNLGIYSYGEIAKSNFDNSTIIHNHTLTIATFYET